MGWYPRARGLGGSRFPAPAPWARLARFRCLCEMSFGGLCEVTTLTAFAHAIWRKGGPRCDFVWEGVRVSSARTQHLTVVLCVRPCSITTSLPCVAEGGSFFAAADTAGERAPFETIGRYAFFQVRRACAPMVGSRKSLFLNGFSHALVRMGENEAFGGLRTMFLWFHCFKGGGGSCRRQGKSAAPRGRRASLVG